MFFSGNCHNWRDHALPPRLRIMLSLAIPSPHPPVRPYAFLAATILAMVAGLPALPAQAQEASDQQRCLGETAVGIDKRIEACSSLIGKSGTRKDDLIGFYVARGDAQRQKGQLDAAADDYGQALKLDGGHAEAL